MLLCMEQQNAAALITTSQAARILGVAEVTVRGWERAGRLQAIRTGHGVRLFDVEEIERLAIEREAAARARAAA